jgi:hypothetical protein
MSFEKIMDSNSPLNEDYKEVRDFFLLIYSLIHLTFKQIIKKLNVEDV